MKHHNITVTELGDTTDENPRARYDGKINERQTTKQPTNR